jgi:hypothetical protein
MVARFVLPLRVAWLGWMELCSTVIVSATTHLRQNRCQLRDIAFLQVM